MQPLPRRPHSASRASSLSRAIAYDLGRTARHLADGAGAVVDVVRDVTGAHIPAQDPSEVAHEPRVELVFDPRARARGQFMPAALALKLRQGEVEQVAWSSSAANVDELAAHLRQCLEALDESMRSELGHDQVMASAEAVVAIADASGLTRALDEVRRRALRFDRDPTLSLLADRLEALGPNGRRELVERFAKRIASAPELERVVQSTGFRPVTLGPEDLHALVPVLAAAGRESLLELGLDDVDLVRLATITNHVSEPLTQLAELYLTPRTLGQHVRRSWRLHRITLTALRLANRAPGRRP